MIAGRMGSSDGLVRSSQAEPEVAWGPQAL